MLFPWQTEPKAPETTDRAACWTPGARVQSAIFAENDLIVIDDAERRLQISSSRRRLEEISVLKDRSFYRRLSRLWSVDRSLAVGMGARTALLRGSRCLSGLFRLREPSLMIALVVTGGGGLMDLRGRFMSLGCLGMAGRRCIVRLHDDAPGVCFVVDRTLSSIVHGRYFRGQVKQ